MMVANKAAEEGIRNVVTVHDSFGCLASQAGRFREVILGEFVRLYEQDVLGDILDEAKGDLPSWKEWPEVPRDRTDMALDLKEVLEAKYAFA
jgi:DNA-directed RNA polymerase